MVHWKDNKFDDSLVRMLSIKGEKNQILKSRNIITDLRIIKKGDCKRMLQITLGQNLDNIDEAEKILKRHRLPKQHWR